jgi:Carbohydrate/starch-binding module (family 21)
MNLTVTPVRLKYAIAQSVDVEGKHLAYTYLKVKVQDLEDAEKIVELFYKNSNGTWESQPLTLQSNYGDYEVFEAIDAPYTEEFAIQCTADGVAYWDSNNGVNYKLNGNNFNAIGGQVLLNKATVVKGGLKGDSWWIEGEIYAKKISYKKRVGIIFSGDDGNSWQEIDAQYQGVETEGAYNSIFNTPIEVWKFKTPAQDYPAEPAFFRLAVYYRNDDTGESYWDNNFGQDYKLTKSDGYSVE